MILAAEKNSNRHKPCKHLALLIFIHGNFDEVNKEKPSKI